MNISLCANQKRILCLYLQVIFKWIERKESHESDDNKPTTSPIENIGLHPIDDTLLWHKATKEELNETFEKIKQMYRSGDFQSQQEFDERLKFIREICLFQRYFILL